jgi:hypothetical protein
MGLACISVRKRRSRDPTASRSVPGEDQNAPLQFQQPMEMVGPLPLTCPPAEQDRHLAQGRGVSQRGQITDDGFEVSNNCPFTFFPRCCDPVPRQFEFRYWDLVRSASRKIFCVGGSEESFLLARRALRRSSNVRKRRKSVELGPIHARSRVRSFRSKVS